MPNKGKGRAMKTGFQYILDHFSEGNVIVTLDTDGQHRTIDAQTVCEAVEHHPDTLILGSRKLSESVPIRSQLGNTITRHVYTAATGLKVHDTQTGLRGFHRMLLPKMLEINGERYEYEMNVLLECAKENIPMIEVEIATVYLDQKNSASHFHTVKDSYRVYREILRFSASSFLSFLVDYGMYTVLSIVTGNLQLSDSLWISNVGARCISASVNYNIKSENGLSEQKKCSKNCPAICDACYFYFDYQHTHIEFSYRCVGAEPLFSKNLYRNFLLLH